MQNMFNARYSSCVKGTISLSTYYQVVIDCCRPLLRAFFTSLIAKFFSSGIIDGGEVSGIGRISMILLSKVNDSEIQEGIPSRHLHLLVPFKRKINPLVSTDFI